MDQKDVQISKYQTSKKLVELVSKLKRGYPPANETDNVKLHHNWSKIGITIIDYSNGVGDKSIIVRSNLNPEHAKFIMENIKIMIFLAATKPQAAIFKFTEEKIMPGKTENGKQTTTQLLIARNPVGGNGEVRKQPWTIQIENGVATPQQTQTGGTVAAKGSYEARARANITLTDKDIYCLFSKATDYIDLWNTVAGANLVRYELQKQQNKENNPRMHPTDQIIPRVIA